MVVVLLLMVEVVVVQGRRRRGGGVGSRGVHDVHVARVVDVRPASVGLEGVARRAVVRRLGQRLHKLASAPVREEVVHHLLVPVLSNLHFEYIVCVFWERKGSAGQLRVAWKRKEGKVRDTVKGKRGLTCKRHPFAGLGEHRATANPSAHHQQTVP